MDKINKEFREAICDRLEAWELVEFLQIPVRDVFDQFEEQIEENLDDVLELVGMRILYDQSERYEDDESSDDA